MRLPQVVILETDGWLAKQLRELAGESRWLVQAARSADAALSLARRQPAVLLVQFEPVEAHPAPLQLIADVHRLAPETPVVAVADVKLPDAERAAWTAALLDLGARLRARAALDQAHFGRRHQRTDDRDDSSRARGGDRLGAARREASVLDLADEGTEA